MEVTSKEQKRAELLLQSQHIGLHQIKSFSFMKRYHQIPRKSNLVAKDKYGPGILTLHLKDGKEKAIYLLSVTLPRSSAIWSLKKSPSTTIHQGNGQSQRFPQKHTGVRHSICSGSLSYSLYSLYWDIIPSVATYGGGSSRLSFHLH